MAKGKRTSDADSIEEVSELKLDGGVKKRRFDQRDWSYVAEWVIDEYNRRKSGRSDREKQWAEIDRQIAMTPDISHKLMPDGSIDKDKRWMAEMELPLQAQTLEVLTADTRKMMFPDTGRWFNAHAELTDEYLKRVDFKSHVLGDDMEVPSQINQDNANKLVQGFLNAQFRQYDFMQRIDRCNAESFKYGLGIGRARVETKAIVSDEAMGTFKTNKKIPVLHPCSVKNVYIDEPLPSMHSAQALSPAHIAVDYISLANLQIAASKGGNEPRDADGGWMPKAAGDLTSDSNGNVTLIEMEGDIVIPRKTTRSFVLHGAIVTVALGGKTSGGGASSGVVRFRFKSTSYSSYLLFPYHYEGADDHYPTSPLMKGRPLQMMATDALNRLMDSAALKNAPPVGYSKDDMAFAEGGGPQIYPNAQWNTVEGIKVYEEVGGDPAALASTLQLAINMYADLTGTQPARLGAQTKSHTTAYSSNSEIQRGAVRTVDYIASTGQGPITRWLDMSYQMSRDILTPKENVSFFIPEYGGYVSITKDMLPERSQFEWFGAGGPAEEQQKTQVKMSALQLGLKMDQIAVQYGLKPTLNVPAAIREVLREGGWSDLDQIVQMQPPQQPPAVMPQVVAEAIKGLPAPGGGLPSR
jgi:hypothetical protein